MTYVGVDFESDDLMSRLVEAGFDAAAPAFFLWLGRGALPDRGGRDGDAAGDRVGARRRGGLRLHHPTHRLEAQAQSDRTDLIARVAEVGEPLSEGLETESLHALLAELGFDEVEDLGRPQIRERFLGRPGGAEGGGAHLLRARA